MAMSMEKIVAMLQKIKEIAESAGQKVTDQSAKEQMSRIAGLADSALIDCQGESGKAVKGG